jgi:glycosyltransferase involved in cell wall biosynthesis
MAPQSKPRIVNLPIEPIPARYSVEWDAWFKEAFADAGADCVTVYGDAGPPPPPDKFLNPHGTFRWKFSQLRKAVDEVGDEPAVIFLHDGWFPGSECFAYLKDLAGARVRVASFWHAGSYDPTDLLGIRGCDRWAGGSEETWLEISDRVFCATRYHARKITGSRRVSDDKIRVVGCPVDVRACRESWGRRYPIVVWPHRPSEDKHPEVFDRLAADPRFGGVEFVKTVERGLDKRAYRELLGKATVAVSTATHENFGIAMVEAACAGCVPVCPRGLSYDETMPPDRLYDSYEDMVRMVEVGLAGESPYHYPKSGDYDCRAVTRRVALEVCSLGGAA